MSLGGLADEGGGAGGSCHPGCGLRGLQTRNPTSSRCGFSPLGLLGCLHQSQLLSK